ncbi:GNAT family N-acetyltransferase [Prochlorothrix hollandica]|uniref:GNAT family N-acetyltransferase n=1 Tax=Prochlorothrix hollandica TaxID=1223 RepID=UPI003341C3CF
MIRLDPYHPGDRLALVQVLQTAVLSLGPTAYTASQVTAWATVSGQRLLDNPQGLLQGITLVARPEGLVARPEADAGEGAVSGAISGAVSGPIAGPIAAFGQLDPWDRIACLYTAPPYVRQGYGTALYRELEAIARSRGVCHLRTESSHLARPFFQHHGFQVVAREEVTLQGITLERFPMVKSLVDP